MLMCSGPLVITSGKYSNWNEVPRDKPLTIGLAGPGTTSHLVAELIRAKYPLSEVVSYRSTNEPMVDAMARRVDFAVGFVEPAEQFIDTGRLNALGVTGTKTVRKIPTLHSQGFVNADVVVNHHSWLVSKQMLDSKFRKLQEIARESIKSPNVQEEFNNLHCEHKGLVGEAADKWFNIQVTFWRDQSKKALENSK
jgi:tripartite-type tricarboxylate transporter receptor subunit TctC